MTRFTAIITMAMFWIAGSTGLSEARAAEDVPKIACDAPIYDFGELDNEGSVEHDFVIRNDGTAPLKIGRVKASCGCTVATVSKKVLEPGEQTKLHVRFVLKGRKGVQTKSIAVESDDPARSRLQLWIKGTAMTEVSANPYHLNFGAIDMNKAATREVTVTSKFPGLEIISAECKTPEFSIDIWPAGDKRGLGLNVAMAGQATVKYLRGNVVVMTNHPRKPQIKIPVFAQIRGSVQIVPRTIVLRKSSAGPQTRSILVRPGAKKVFKVERVECGLEGAKIEIKSDTPNNYRIIIRDLVVGDELDGRQIKIFTDLPEMKEIVVPIKVVKSTAGRHRR